MCAQEDPWAYLPKQSKTLIKDEFQSLNDSTQRINFMNSVGIYWLIKASKTQNCFKFFYSEVSGIRLRRLVARFLWCFLNRLWTETLLYCCRINYNMINLTLMARKIQTNCGLSLFVSVSRLMFVWTVLEQNKLHRKLEFMMLIKRFSKRLDANQSCFVI